MENCELARLFVVHYIIILITCFGLSTTINCRLEELKINFLFSMSVQPVFKRFLRLEKEYLSFSLIYNIGERSLDLFSQTSNIFCTYYILS